jgi:hypothetical protein
MCAAPRLVDNRRRGPTGDLSPWMLTRGAAALLVVAAVAAVPAAADAATVRTIALRGGLTSVDLQVLHKTAFGPVD